MRDAIMTGHAQMKQVQAAVVDDDLDVPQLGGGKPWRLEHGAEITSLGDAL